MLFAIEVEQEEDGRWLAEVPALRGSLVYAQTREEAVEGAKALALRVLADRVEHDESVPDPPTVFVVRP
jgi:predicted RNase H-like HicB family nuclease